MPMRRLHSLALTALMLLGAVVLLSCGKVVETTAPQPGVLGYAPACTSPLGAYYLPKTLLVVKAEAKASPNVIELNDLGTVQTSDRTQPLCLDYLGSATSDDVVTVKRSENGLLETVASHVVDRTPQIAEALIKTGANLAVAAGRGAVLKVGDTVKVEFDPFDWQDLMIAKTALRRFGICVYVEGYSFPTKGLSAAARRAAGQRWCAARHPRPYVNHAVYYASLPVPPDVMRTGILYRPYVSHKIVIMRKDDPSGPERWHVYRTKRVDMPNVGPILSIGVERAMFATRDTDLNFQDGVLTDVKIKKGSELVGFISIPLAVAKAIVSVPAEIIQVRIADIGNQTALLNAQGQLANTLASIKAQNEGGSRSAPTSRSAEAALIANCINAGGDSAGCARYAQGLQ